MLSGPPTTEIAFFAVIKHHHQKQLLEETGLGRVYFTLPLTVYEGKWGHELQTESGGRSQNRGHRGVGGAYWFALRIAQLAFSYNPEAPS